MHGSGSPTQMSVRMFLVALSASQGESFERLLTNAHSALTLSRHSKKARGDEDYFCNESLDEELRVHNPGSHVLPFALVGASSQKKKGYSESVSRHRSPQEKGLLQGSKASSSSTNHHLSIFPSSFTNFQDYLPDTLLITQHPLD